MSRDLPSDFVTLLSEQVTYCIKRNQWRKADQPNKKKWKKKWKKRPKKTNKKPMVSSGLHATEVKKKKKKKCFYYRQNWSAKFRGSDRYKAYQVFKTVGHALQLEMLGMPLCHFNQGSMNTCHIHVYKSISRSWSWIWGVWKWLSANEVADVIFSEAIRNIIGPGAVTWIFFKRGC